MHTVISEPAASFSAAQSGADAAPRQLNFFAPLQRIAAWWTALTAASDEVWPGFPHGQPLPQAGSHSSQPAAPDQLWIYRCVLLLIASKGTYF